MHLRCRNLDVLDR